MLWQAVSKLGGRTVRYLQVSTVPWCQIFFFFCLGGVVAEIGVILLLIQMKVKVPIAALEVTIFNYSQCI